MVNVMTNPITLRDIVIGVAWQGLEGTPVTPTMFINADVFKINPQVEKLDPQGTHGSEFKRRDGRRPIAIVPLAELTYWPTKTTLPLFLESHTQKSFVNNADLTETGDGSAQLNNYALTGVRPRFNVDTNRKIYISIVSAVQVDFFSDAAKTLLIGRVTVAGVGVSIAEQNNSGFGGTVDFAFSGADTDIELTINTVRFGWNPTITDFFTLDYENGQRKFRLVDCYVNKIEFTSGEKTALMTKISIAAKNLTRPIPVDTLAGNKPDDFDTFAHKEFILTDNAQVLDLAVREFTLTSNTPYDPFVGNSETPQKLIKDAFVGITGQVTSRWSDEFQVWMDKGFTETFFDMVAKYTFSAKRLEFTLRNISINPDVPGVSGRAVDQFQAAFEAYYDGTLNPMDVLLDL